MKQTFNVGMIPSKKDKYFDDIKNTLVEKGIVEENTPDSELNDVVKQIDITNYLGLRLGQTEPYEYSNSKITSIPRYAFYEDDKITSLSFPNATVLNSYAFYGCNALQSVKAPNATTIGGYTFEYTPIFEVDYPLVTSIGSYAFAECKSILNVNLPSLTTGAKDAFRNAYAIETVNMPLLNRVENSMFYRCNELQYINLPNATSIESGGFHGCYSLKSANFESLTSITATSFYDCHTLQALIIQTNSVVTLGYTSAFTGCYHILGTTNQFYNPTGAKDGYIYVPDNLVEGYKAATNWSVYASQIKGLSELPQEYKDLYGIA